MGSPCGGKGGCLTSCDDPLVASEAIAPYDPAWPQQFDILGQRLRQALGHQTTRIDHIGSTAVPDLAGKPIIDVQISVADLAAVSDYGPGIESCGFEWLRDNPELTKRCFRELPSRRCENTYSCAPVRQLRRASSPPVSRLLAVPCGPSRSIRRGEARAQPPSGDGPAGLRRGQGSDRVAASAASGCVGAVGQVGAGSE